MRCGSSSSYSNRPLSSLLLLGTILSLLLLLLSIIPYCNAEDEVTIEKDTSSSSPSYAADTTTTAEGSVDHDTTFDHDHDDDDEEPPHMMKTSTTNENVEEEEDDDLLLPDFLIVGAGGGGIQMALYLEKYGYTYKILEKSNNVGNFWTKFPIFDELISVNKYLDDIQQQMRYDWHSLLETPNIKMWQNITEDYFPKGEDWHTYMKLVVKEAGILPHIEYNTEVDMILPSISKEEETPCLLLKSGKQQQRCAKHKIFVATGLQEREEPFLRAMGGIRYSEIPNYVSSEYGINEKKPKPNSNYYKHRRVCVLGNGNSGFEVAQNLYKVAGKVVIYGKEPHRLSSVTRYTGDVRTKYLQVLENHNAKLLDDVGHFFWWKKDDVNPKTKGMDRDTKHWTNHYGLTIPQSYQINTMIKILYFIIDFECDTLILTTGFESSVPNGMEMKYTPQSDNIQEQKKSKRKFPKTNDWYESTTNPNVHLLGWLMHERDFRRGAGGFLSGYRYLVRNLFYQIHSDLQGRPYPHYVFTKKQVINHVIKRVQTADDLIILQDGVIIRDAIIKIPTPDDDEEEEVEEYYYYYEGITYNFHNFQNEEEEKDQDDNNVDVDVGDGDDGSSNNDVVTEDDENGVPNNKEEQQQKQREEKEEMKKKYEYTPIYLYFTWGDGRDTEAVFEAHIRYDSGRLINRFLHPAIEIGNKGELMRDIHEDLEMEWKLPGYMDAVKRVITNALDGNFDKFKKRTFYPYERKEIPHPPDRPKKQAYNFEVADLRKRRKPGRGEIDFKAKREEIPKLIPTIVESASKYYNDTTHRSDGIAELTARIKQFLPALFEYEDFMNDNDLSIGKQQAAPASPHSPHENTWNDDNAVDFERERGEEEDSYVPAGSCDEVFEEEDEEGTDNSPSLSKSSPAGLDDLSTASSGEGNTFENLQARLAALETKLESVLSDEL